MLIPLTGQKAVERRSESGEKKEGAGSGVFLFVCLLVQLA